MHLSFYSTLRWKSAFRSLLSWVVGLLLVAQLWAGGAAIAEATGVYNLPASVDDSTWVIDEAEILSRFSEGSLSTQFAELAKTTGHAVRFVTIHRLDYGETVESFADQLFEQWFPTPDAQAHQVLLVLDNVTNTAAIRTGEAVQATLTGDIANSVAQETLQVPLRDGNKYNQAFADAGDRLVAVLSGQPDPGAPVVAANIQTEGTFASAEATKANVSNSTAWVIGLLIAATVIPMATYYLYQVNQSSS
jgi:uncharacterized protein